MSLADWHRRMVVGNDWRTAPVRAALRAIATGYETAVCLRNARFDRLGPSVTLDKPTISVGNVTVGGTGKTPLVIELVRRLSRMGIKPAVLARGYGGQYGSINDEERLIRDRCPGVVYAANPDRAKAAQSVRSSQPEAYILDDGFQHRRIARRLDLVLIDATCPFGHGQLLPRGLLREPVSALSRAHAIVLTRCDQVSDSDRIRIESTLRQYAGSLIVLRTRHTIVGVEPLTRELAVTASGGLPPTPDAWDEDHSGVSCASPFGIELRERRVTLVSAIGNPRAFRSTVESLGAIVIGESRWPDHHAYQCRDLDRLARVTNVEANDWLVTTEKDAVKLRRLDHPVLERFVVVRVAIEFLADDAKIFDDLLRACFCRDDHR